MKKILFIILFSLALTVSAHSVYDSEIKTLQVVMDQNWTDIPLMKLNSDEVLNISFDQLSHTYHRYTYKIVHCEADWSESSQLLESDYLQGFNNNTIDDYDQSMNTNVLYTHYALHIPNDKCVIKMSGNYKLSVYDEDNDNKKVLDAYFMVLDSKMNVGLSVTTNTDIDINKNHQQVSMTLGYGSLSVSNPSEQIHTVIMQNGTQGEHKVNIKPDYMKADGLQWTHNKNLIFEGGNEYHKFEALSTVHPTMGVERITWDENKYNIYPFVDEPRNNYLYDEDANGAFYIRNSDNDENDITCDYVLVHYKLKLDSDNIQQIHFLKDCSVRVDGNWVTDFNKSEYEMNYDNTDKSFNTAILQKQGYYSYRYVVIDDTGMIQPQAIEPSFYQTENEYQALVYYRPQGGRTDLLVGYADVDFK